MNRVGSLLGHYKMGDVVENVRLKLCDDWRKRRQGDLSG